ncbi:MAG: exosome complex protein Rrp42 [Candidatus Aenigmatarchaeota archaeon]
MSERYAFELIQKGMRLDERKFDEFRPINIKLGVSNKAEGSAQVTLGETVVIAGVKMKIGEPFADTPNEGTLMVGAEFTPLSSPDFESGPPSEDAVELARVVDRGLRESHCLDLEKLCVTPKEKVWSVYVDLHIINHQGNLLDACALAAIAALQNSQIPKLEEDTILRGDYAGKLPVGFTPINVTVGKIGNKFILDPLMQEENILDSKLSISVRDDDKICALQKMGEHGIDLDDLEKMFDMAIKKSKELRELVK